MNFLTIALLIFFLYAKSLRYNYVIDDAVRREQYLWCVPDKGLDPKFYDTKPSPWYRLFMIGMHIVNTFIIYTLWGWQGALIFAVHPMSVWGVAWLTGNYYATTAYFTLISYFFATQAPLAIGIPASLIFFYCALNSTVDAMTYPFFLALTGHPGFLLMGAPLIVFLNRERWKVGLQTRVDIIKGKQVDELSWSWNRPILMTKIMARYIETFFLPMKVYFFDSWAEDIRESREAWDGYHAPNKQFWVSLLLCLSVFIGGMLIHPIGTMWFFVFMGLHSQFKVLGQPFAQRYLYLPQIGLCVVLGTVLANYPIALFMYAGALAFKTWQVIPNWEHQTKILENEVAMMPNRGGSYSALAQYYISRKKLLEYRPWKVNYVSSLIRHAVDLSPESWVVNMNFCAYLVMVGKIDEAIATNEKTIALLEKYGTERERPNIEGAVKQLEWLRNLRVDAIKQAKKKGKK